MTGGSPECRSPRREGQSVEAARRLYRTRGAAPAPDDRRRCVGTSLGRTPRGSPSEVQTAGQARELSVGSSLRLTALVQKLRRLCAEVPEEPAMPAVERGRLLVRQRRHVLVLGGAERHAARAAAEHRTRDPRAKRPSQTDARVYRAAGLLVAGLRRPRVERRTFSSGQARARLRLVKVRRSIRGRRT